MLVSLLNYRDLKMNSKIILGTLSFIVLTGCASYNALPLNSMSSEIIDVTKPAVRTDITIAAKALSRSECIKYFDRDIIEKGYLPVQLYIQNNTKNAYVFSLSRVSLSVARPEVVAEKVHTSTVTRAACYGAGALLLWPLAIPAVIDGMKSANANEALDADFDAKCAQDQIIAMHSHMNKVLFVPRAEFDSSFTVTLVDAESHTPKTIQVQVQRS